MLFSVTLHKDTNTGVEDGSWMGRVTYCTRFPSPSVTCLSQSLCLDTYLDLPTLT